MKKYLTIVFVLFLISFASAIKFGISPEKIILNGENNELICANFTLIGDSNLIYEGEIKFSEREAKELADYKLNAEEIGLKIIYDKQTFKGPKKICVVGKDSKYYGAITYKIAGTNYGVGTWLEINIGNENLFIRAKSITGSAIKRIDNSEQIGLATIFISLFILLIFIIKGYRNKILSSPSK